MSPADFLAMTGGAPATVSGPGTSLGSQAASSTTASTSTWGAALWTAGAFFSLIVLASLLAHYGKE